MNLEETAAKLTEKIFNIQGSNRANEVQKLIFTTLSMCHIYGYKEGWHDRNKEEELRDA